MIAELKSFTRMFRVTPDTFTFLIVTMHVDRLRHFKASVLRLAESF